ncbi:ribonuclease H2 subunit A [Xylariaceae sp. FL0255]|nr:ribonuclease H2 subunit A [Xylariaceae sp. FL0255]
MEDIQPDETTLALETPTSNVFVPPSIHRPETLSGISYEHFSPVPPSLNACPDQSNPGVPCVLGVDEAGRGPVLGPMVYGVFYLPTTLSTPLLKTTHHFDDSKVLTPAVRSSLMQTLCTPSTDLPSLYASCGWATSSLSARDIAANMLRPSTIASYNLNAQAMDATASLITGVLSRGVNVTEIYVDTIGQPATYQKRLERQFPSIKITVAKKADSLYPCVSAASVCAKVTRDAALEVLYEAHSTSAVNGDGKDEALSWGSGYPSDARCVSWLKRNMHPVFGWGPECRFSWGTAKDMLESTSKGGIEVEWPADEDESTSRMTDFFVSAGADGGGSKDADELGTWFGTPAGLEAF